VEEAEFAAGVERWRGELRVHCYRMTGSFEEAEDLVQETFLRGWKNLGQFAGRASLRAWLYKIATNACLDALRGRGRRVLPHEVGAAGSAATAVAERADLPWLQPFPDRLLEARAPAEEEPDAVAVRRETIELAFLAAIQHLPARQRAVLILRDVLGWPAKDTAELLDGTVAATNSALQRARVTLREHLPGRRVEWDAGAAASEDELALLRRYMDAVERADLGAVAEVLAAEVRATMPPYTLWFDGRDSVLEALRLSWDPAVPGYVGRFRTVETRANGQPAVAAYTNGEAFAISVFRVEGGQIAEMTAFHSPQLFPAFGLPMSFPG
jgi:RNA polymerase sigma-70 factor, ECF subfamily